jgi:hypothetical protein
MPTSGSYSFTVTRDDIINSALRTLNVLDSASVASGNDLTYCSQALNLLMKQWADAGMPLWCVQWIQIPMVANKASYTMGPGGDVNLAYRPTRIISSFLRQNSTNNDTTIQIVSRQEYEQLGIKSSASVVNQIYYDAQLPIGTMYCYSVPSDATYTLWVSVQRPIMDVVNGTDNFDVPQEFFMLLKWALVEELSLEYAAPPMVVQIAAQKAEHYKTTAFNWQQEETSVFFSIDPQTYYLGR